MDDQFVMQKAQDLVNQMTLEEKASQLRYNAPAIQRLGIPSYNWWNEALHGIARAGTATVFPQAIGLAAMFDDQLLKDIAEVIAEEGRAKFNAQFSHGDHDIYKGLTFWSPNINIFRDPRWGRGHETYGEDPYLTARLGVAFVKGLQGEGSYLKAAACAKHYAVHSGPEGLRHEFDAQVSQKDLWETYLPAFEALVKEANVEAVMGAYNRVNGEPCCGSQTLLVEILRKKWGFKGHIVSDCWAISDFHMHHKVTATAPESAALALKNTCDLNCGNIYLHLLQAYEDGLVTEEQITQSTTRLMATRIRLGLFDPDCEFNTINYSVNDCDEHAELAREAARKCMVLLKNDGILPLNKEKLKSIAVIGPNADNIKSLEGNYAGTSSRNVTFLEGIRQSCESTRVYYSLGCHLYKDRTSGLAGADDRLSEAVTLVELTDVSVLCLGLDATLEGEEGDTGNEFSSGDKRDLELPLSQRKLLEAVVAVGKPVIVVLAAGSSLSVVGSNALIAAWYPGQAGGLALADILFGKVSPAGRLPATFYRTISDLPDFCDYSMEGRTYRYFNGTPLYPFGYGLSYTNFEYSAVHRNGDDLIVTVKNTGTMASDEVVQVYGKPCNSPHAPLNPSLCAFKRIHLEAGEMSTLHIAMPQSAFQVVNEEGQRVSGGRSFILYVGGSQPDARSTSLMGRAPLEYEWIQG